LLLWIKLKKNKKEREREEKKRENRRKKLTKRRADKDRRVSLLFVYTRPFRNEKQPRELVSRAELSKGYAFDLFRDLIAKKKKQRYIRSFWRASITRTLEKT